MAGSIAAPLRGGSHWAGKNRGLGNLGDIDTEGLGLDRKFAKC
jgi:hypothetical protein